MATPDSVAATRNSNISRATTCGLLLVTVLIALTQIEFSRAEQPNPAGASSNKANSHGPFEGCHHLNPISNKWDNVLCASDESQKDSSQLSLANAIQSTPRVVFLFTTQGVQATGSLSVNTNADPTLASETDATVTAARNATIAEQFRMQISTNVFPCTQCSKDGPFSRSQEGDLGMVLFTYQERESLNKENQSANWLCVWTIDLTIVQKLNNGKILPTITGGVDAAGANNAIGYDSKCVSPSPNRFSGAADQKAEIFGLVTCPSAPTNVVCTVHAFAYLGWADGWWHVGQRDLLGLRRTWTTISLSTLGKGGPARVSFANTPFQQLLRAYSCFVAGSTPQPCQPPSLQFGWIRALSAEQTILSQFQIQDQKNLPSGPMTFACETLNCTLSYDPASPAQNPTP
jgi:hypothetical protein